ncbi:MAG TPA: cobalamin B12-binding domain-containing protein [Ktedonobacterales bacterium]|jgi:methylmalonyl-CoA mutase C-terminal domain/subunit
MTEERKIRVLVAKPGLDGHDRGAKVIARALRDAGMEVIYTGIRQTPSMIAEAAVQEDVDAILMSILSGAHMALFPRVMELLRQYGVDDVLVLAGGILPDEDRPAIEALGIKGNFGPGTSTQQIVDYVRQNVQRERLARELPPLARTADPAATEPATGAAGQVKP